METARCRAFLLSAESGSFSRAAELLNYTPSGVSQLVTALEEDFGFSLLRRSRKGVTLTAAGEKLLPAVRGFLREEERLQQMAGEIRGVSIGEITIASYASISAHWLPAVLRGFQREYPGIRVHLMEGIHQEIAQWLTEAQADLGFFSYQEPMPYDWIPLAEDPMLAILPRDHPLAGAERYPLARCREERFIMPALGRDADVAALFAAHDIEPEIAFSTLESYAALSMIEQGLGMTVANGLSTRNWVCDVVKLPLDPPQSITLGIALPSLEYAAPAVRCFVDFAVRALSRPEEGI